MASGVVQFHALCCNGDNLEAVLACVEKYNIRPESINERRLNVIRNAFYHGNYDVLKWYIEYCDIPIEHIFERDMLDGANEFNRACMWGHAKCLQYLVKHYNISKDQINGAFDALCQSGELDTIKWFADHFKITAEDIRATNNALSYACNVGHLNVIKWLIKTYNLTINDILHNNSIALYWLCQLGYLKPLEWIIRRFNLTAAHLLDNNIFDQAVEHQLPLAQWIVDYYNLTVEVEYFGNELNIHPDRVRLVEGPDLGPKCAATV